MREFVDSHKSADLFSSFVMIVGIGALIFARHPALHSIALITILGMVAVVLVAYVAEPVIFRGVRYGTGDSEREGYLTRSELFSGRFSFSIFPRCSEAQLSC